MPRLRINPAVLSDIMRYRGVGVAELSRQLRIPERCVEGWFSGEVLPTWRQLTRLARVLHVPAGYFFLTKTPPLGVDVPDYRNKTGGHKPP